MHYSSAIIIAFLCAGAHTASLMRQHNLYQSTILFDVHSTYDLPHIHSPSGTILMSHKGDSITPVAFTISGACPALSADFSEINKYVGQSLIQSHDDCSKTFPLCQEFQESASLQLGGVGYRATLNLAVEREMGVEFPELIGLLVGTARELFEATGGNAFEMIRLNGKVDEVRFDASWTWYEYNNGVARGCEGF